MEVNRDFRILVDQGFSTSGQNSVGSSFGTLRTQQRLKHLGFPGANGQLIATTGQADDDLQYAIRLFNAAIRGTSPVLSEDTQGDDLSAANSIDKRFINSQSAPHWTLLNTNGITFEPSIICSLVGQPDSCQNSEVWGTNWTGELIDRLHDEAIINAIPPLPVLYASPPAGGKIEVANKSNIDLTSDASARARSGELFDAGREVAFDLPTSEIASRSFFKTRQLQNNTFIAAATLTDTSGAAHTVKFESGQWHTLGESSTKLVVVGSAPWMNTLAQAFVQEANLPAFAVGYNRQGLLVKSKIVAVEPMSESIDAR